MSERVPLSTIALSCEKGVPSALVWSPRIPYPPDGPCPCGSSIKAGACCLVDGRWAKQPANIQAATPITGFSHKKCYLASLHDCSREGSGEHYVSKNILAGISPGEIRIANLPWQLERDRYQWYPIGRLYAKVLCKRHNEALSPLDREVGRLFRAIRSTDDDCAQTAGKRETKNVIQVFSGRDIERWMLKTLLSSFAAGNFRNTSLPPEYLGYVYQDSFPVGWGLYLGITNGTQGHLYNFLDVRVLHINDDLRTIRGLSVMVRGVPFELLLVDPGGVNVGIYRPARIVFETDVVQHICEFTWPSGHSGRTITGVFRERTKGPPEHWEPWKRE